MSEGKGKLRKILVARSEQFLYSIVDTGFCFFSNKIKVLFPIGSVRIDWNRNVYIR